MKKIISLFMLAFLITSGNLFNPITKNANAAETIAAGTVVKGAGLTTLYYLAEDGKRYVFPNDKVFFSWYDDFSQVKEIPTEELYNYPLGGNVTYKPGILLVKIQTNPKVYAVGENGKLHWVKNEQIAKALYGNNWNKLIDDVADSFFTNYQIDEDINSEDDFSPSDEEEMTPTISHNRGLKTRIQAKARSQKEKMCGHLEGALNKLQKRLDRWNIELPNIGDDVLEKCYGLQEDGSEDDNAPRSKEKVTLCHKGETLSVGAAASRAHLRHGDTLGACTGDIVTEDKTAPTISAITATATGTSATITWTTNETANSKVYFGTSTPISSLNSAPVSNTDFVINHSITLTNLISSTSYYYLVESKDEANNIATSSEQSFTSAQ